MAEEFAVHADFAEEIGFGGVELEDEEVVGGVELDVGLAVFDDFAELKGAEHGACCGVLDAGVGEVMGAGVTVEDAEGVGVAGVGEVLGDADLLAPDEFAFGDVKEVGFGGEMFVELPGIDEGLDPVAALLAEGEEGVEVDGAFEGFAGLDGEGCEVVVGVPWRDGFVGVAREDLETEPLEAVVLEKERAA